MSRAESAELSADDDLVALLGAVEDFVFVLNLEGRLLCISASLERRLGPVAGRTFADFVAPPFRAQVQQAIATSALGEPNTGRLSCVLEGDVEHWLDLRLTRGRFRAAPALFGVARQLSGRLPAQPLALERSLLANSELKFGAMFESSLFSMAICDLSGRFLEVNRAFERATGFSVAEVVGKNAHELGLVPPLERERLQRRMANDGSAQLSTATIRRRDGETRVQLFCATRVAVASGVELLFSVSIDVTDYEQAQLRLRERDEKFRALFQSIGDGVFFITTDGRFVDVNNAACRQLGYTHDELLSVTVDQVSGRPGFEFGSVVARLRDSAGQMTYETFNRRKDGSIFPVELTLALIEQQGSAVIAGIARDLTEKQRIESEVRETRDRFRAMLQAQPDLLFEIDHTGRVLDFFSAQPGLLLRPLDQFLGKRVDDVAGSDVAPLVMRAVDEALETGLSTGTRYSGQSQGVERWFELSVARLGEQKRVMAVARDISERKQYEDELVRKNDELMRFTYTVSHDLKSPLVTIRSFLGYLTEDLARGDKARVDRDVAHIHNAAARMSALLDDLLELSRVGRKVNPPTRVALKELGRDACEMVAGRISMRGAEVHIDDQGVVLFGDRVRLLEVFQNLIDNAIKFSPADRAPRVLVSARKVAQEWVVSVRDEGIGIDPRHQHKLFGLFEKLAPDSEGTGIGLALVKRIVEVHGGRIWVDSAGEGQGTTFSFVLSGTTQEGAS